MTKLYLTVEWALYFFRTTSLIFTLYLSDDIFFPNLLFVLIHAPTIEWIVGAFLALDSEAWMAQLLSDRISSKVCGGFSQMWGTDGVSSF